MWYYRGNVVAVLGALWTVAAVAEETQHWALRGVIRPELPAVRNRAAIRSPIDRFVVGRLEAEGIGPSSSADRTTLLRRISLDLIGLPPSAREVDTFLRDESPDAYDRQVDRLLSNPHYGEHWARGWLDLCHYADSDGYLTDQSRPVAWRFRQWLVTAFNSDKPYDAFTIEQLAGDLLPKATVEQRIATGFLRQTLSNREGGADLEEFRVAQIVDRTELLGTIWLGLTVGCARCHDHKYDPLSQRDFFSLFAFFDQADEINIDAPLPGELGKFLEAQPQYDRQRRALIGPVESRLTEFQHRWEAKLLYAAQHPGEDHVWDRHWEVLGLVWGGNLGEGQLEGCEIVKRDHTQRSPNQHDRILDYFLRHGTLVDPPAESESLNLKQLSEKLEKLSGEVPWPTRAMAIRAALNPRQTRIHERGDWRAPGDAVAPNVPRYLTDRSRPAPRDRLALARWLVSGEHPLTSRVAVNRIWQTFFGRGLVLTSDDFGTRGNRPSHPLLLDWLAHEWVRCQWSTKALHRRLVGSATYRQASEARRDLAALDPDNVLLARQANLRLTAEQIRDATLAASGLLSSRIGGPAVRPPQPPSVSEESYGNEWKPSTGEDRYRRALYTWIQRTSPFAQGVTFDAPSPGKSCVRRERSNTPLQALTLLNDPVFFEAARSLAGRLLRAPLTSDDARIELAFRWCLARSPEDSERTRLEAYLRDQTAVFETDPGAMRQMQPLAVDGRNPKRAAVWVGLASVLLNLHEFITRD